MTYRIASIEVPQSNPFVNDRLQRENVVEFVSGIIEKTATEPMVLAIDGPYGSGKSTFIRMLQTVLAARNYQTVYFDAWKVDHVTDPLVALVAELDTAIASDSSTGGLQKKISRIKTVAGVLGKRALIAGVKLGTAGVVDIAADLERIMVDSAGDATKDIVESFQTEMKLNASFRVALQETVECLGELDKKPLLVFFIDELDRCRPDFAVSLLERIKHMFDVSNVVFVLSVDKAQLEGAIASIYGDRIDTVEYLRKFIDLEFRLPSPSLTQFIDSAISRANMDELFSSRRGEMSNDRSNFIRFFAMLSDIFRISLRTQERCILRLKLVLQQTLQQEYLHPAHLALLLVLRMVDAAYFWRIINRTLSPVEIENYIASHENATRYFDKNEWLSLQAILLSEDWNQPRRNQAIVSLQASSGPHNQAAARKLSMIASFENFGLAPGETFEILARKIDLASRVT